MTYGYIHCRLQTLTSHRSSLSFLFGFHNVTMMFMSLCNELTVCLYHPLLLGSEQSNLHGERHKSMKDLKHEMAPPFRVLLFCAAQKTKQNEDVLKLKSLARIRDVALFTVSRCCGPYVILCRNTPTYSMSPSPLASLLHCLDC